MATGLPRATYRLQLHEGFGFEAARRIIGYLDALGISHVYLSPITRAQPGSGHGYDVTEPDVISPELGGEEGFEALLSELDRRGMGVLLDIVPNHMAASSHSPWWTDVLEHGRGSRYANVFDIDWEAEGDRVILPLLGAPYGEALERGELRLEAGNGRLVLRYHEHVLPIRAGSADHLGPSAEQVAAELNGSPGHATSFDRLHDLLEQQHYRLAYWRTGSRELNYRRFFDITDLVSVRVEDPEAFALTHRLVERLVATRTVAGVRVDHIDGLHSPRDYLEQLRERLGEVFVLVEKILDRGEELPADWPVAGTTGYEHLNALGGVFVAAGGAERLREIGDRTSGDHRGFPEVVAEKKRFVLDRLFSGEVDSLVRRVHALARSDRHARDVTRSDWSRALVELTAHLAVYRTYLRAGERPASEDRRRIEAALEGAAGAGAPEAALRFLATLLLRQDGSDPESEAAVMRWQQLTGPAMAKGFEDTALYSWVRLASRNEVGGDPATPAVDPGELHELNRRRLKRWPGALSPGSTHDTKRGEDVRARLDVLSEIPDRWERRLRRWARMNERHRSSPGGRPCPAPGEELLLYQTLVGAWPLHPTGRRRFSERVGDYMVKAAREAKEQTDWHDPDEAYERASRRYVSRILSPRNKEFLDDLASFSAYVARYGALNSLAQTVVRCSGPGVPDVYQGSELWHLRLVDPDNRAPVDYEERTEALERLTGRNEEPGLARELLGSWQDGAVKMFVLHRCLGARRARPALFAAGDYLPLEAAGPRRDNVLAFARRTPRPGGWALTVVPRLATGLATVRGFPLGAKAWGRTAVTLPSRAPGAWEDAFTGRRLHSRGGKLALAELFAEFPVALLTSG